MLPKRCRVGGFDTAMKYHSSTVSPFSLLHSPFLLLVRPTAVCKNSVTRYAGEGACVFSGSIPNKGIVMSTHCRCRSSCCYGNTAWNRYAGQLVIIKCPIPDGSNAVSNGNTGQLVLPKCIIPDLNNAVGYSNTGQFP